MKKLTRFRMLTLMIIIATLNVTAQNPDWNWARHTATDYHENLVSFVTKSDLYNNTWTQVQYYDSIHIEDTLFNHSNTYNSVKHAWACHDSSGRFIHAIDIYSVNNASIFRSDVVRDKHKNTWIAGCFSNTAFLQDTTFTWQMGTHHHPEIFLARLNKDLEVEWGGMISSTVQDDLSGLLADQSGNLYISAIHLAGIAFPPTVNFFDQDTLQREAVFSSLTKLSPEGEVQWISEIEGTLSGVQGFIMGNDSLLYVTGRSFSDLLINGQMMVERPESASWVHYVVAFSQDGQPVFAKFVDRKMWFYHVDVDVEGNKYFSGSFVDTLVLGQDTIIKPGTDNWFYVAAFDPQLEETLWYRTVRAHNSQSVNTLNIKCIDEGVFFASHGKGLLIFDNQILDLGLTSKLFMGNFDYEGNLTYLMSPPAGNEINLFSLILDNCQNPVLGGTFKGNAYFGQDTISSTSYQYKDAFIAKLKLHEPPEIDLGNDTLVCGQFTIEGPQGYTYYIWNESLTNQSWFTAGETGLYTLACAMEEGCWAMDSIYISVHPEINAQPLPDSSICIMDSLLLEVQDGYESYLWSTGDTLNYTWIDATIFGAGEHPVWIEIADGPCIYGDTAVITVFPAIEIDMPDTAIICYDDTLNISVAAGYESYLWSSGDTGPNLFLTGEALGTGENWLTLEVINGPCYWTDSMLVDVYPVIELSLPADTTISVNDTIVLSVPYGYDTYQWSTGESGPDIEVYGPALGIGNHSLGIEVTHGPCFEAFTVTITVHSDYGIHEQNGQAVSVYPNPSTGKVTIASKSAVAAVRIIDAHGILHQEISGLQNEHTTTINLSNQQPGVYFLQILTGDRWIYTKVLKY